MEQPIWQLFLCCAFTLDLEMTQEISSFEEVKWRLQEMLDVCPQYLYYISMLHALSGQGSDADATYREYLQRGVKFRDEDAPGLRMISDVHSSSGRRQQRRNIWHTLVDMVTKSGLPQPLHVLWRSHLPPLRICDPSSLYFSLAEADLCCDYLDLRLNSQGYLTGNLKMMLPPMRSINLDPYTGRLCFPQTPGRTETWTSLDKFYDNEGDFYSHSDNGCIPCPLKVFHHADGTTVLMLVPSPLKRQCEFRSNVEIQRETCITLFWSDGKGQSATLNVVNILRLILFEKVKKRIRNEPILRKNSEKWQKDCFRLLKHHYDTKSLINYDDIVAAVSAYNTEREKCPKSQWNSKQLLDMNTNKSASLLWDNDYVSYGETLAFTFQFNNECISVFVDCSSRRGFLHPTIKFEPHLLKHFGEIPNCRDHDHKVVGGRIFYYPMSDRTCLMVYGERGRLIQKINCNKEDNLPYIIGSSLLRVTNQKRLWCWHDRSIKEAGDTLPDVQTITPLDCSVVMVMLKETGYFRFVNVPSLETVVIRSGCDMKGIQITDNGLEIKAKFTVVKVLSNHSRTGLDHCYREAILGMDMNLVTLQIQEDGSSSPEVVVTQVLPISGFPVEHCFVGEKNGYLLSWTQQNKLAKEYKEHVSYFSKDSELLGILPCVGTGPRSFCPLYLPGDTETQKENPEYGLPGWYVYMRDGYDGIIGVKLPTR
ncbi:uncharacterized protein LOC117328885 [Pecten maximus]|uniref:uncharacterized protein LOC117328885 n=1 Tax=Pecten maximus TaxID=6579 RepID=UPI0014580593|nr:uncharacterized protein LOC117328885 [Pecten maximus]